MEAYQERGFFCVGGRRREENECVRKRLVLMCGREVFMEKGVQESSMEGGCV
jgi:hypothetical protein